MKRLVLFALLILGTGLTVVAQNPRNVLVYNVTSTDCGPCSCMDSIIRALLLKNFPRTVVIALHSDYSRYRTYQGNEVFPTFRAKYEPSGFIDGLGTDVSYSKLTEAVGQRYLASSEAPVKIEVISKVWDPGSRNVVLTLKFTNTQGELGFPCWFNIFVTEDNLISQHRTNTGCSRPNHPTMPFKVDFVNDHVIRKLEYFEHGDSLIGPNWPSNISFTRSFTVHLDTGWIAGNCNLACAVYHKNDSLYKSEIQQVIVENVTGGLGVEENKTLSDKIMQIHPNPADKWVNIHLTVEHAGNCSLLIRDLTGNVVETLFNQRLERGTYNVEQEVASLPQGVYVLVFTTPAGESVQRLIIH